MWNHHTPSSEVSVVAELSEGSNEQEHRRQPGRWFGAGKRRVPLGAGHPTGVELSSVDPLGGSGEQGLSPNNFVPAGTEFVYKRGLLVAQASVTSFDKPWSILIDSGASGNYVRRKSLGGSQQYAEALKAQKGDTIIRQVHVSPCRKFL